MGQHLERHGASQERAGVVEWLNFLSGAPVQHERGMMMA